jgi:hypothetical protein
VSRAIFLDLVENEINKSNKKTMPRRKKKTWELTRSKHAAVRSANALITKLNQEICSGLSTCESLQDLLFEIPNPLEAEQIDKALARHFDKTCGTRNHRKSRRIRDFKDLSDALCRLLSSFLHQKIPTHLEDSTHILASSLIRRKRGDDTDTDEEKDEDESENKDDENDERSAAKFSILLSDDDFEEEEDRPNSKSENSGSQMHKISESQKMNNRNDDDGGGNLLFPDPRISPTQEFFRINEYGLSDSNLEQIEDLLDEFEVDSLMTESQIYDASSRPIFWQRYLRILMILFPKDWLAHVDLTVQRLNPIVRGAVLEDAFVRIQKDEYQIDDKKTTDPLVERRPLGSGSYSKVVLETYRCCSKKSSTSRSSCCKLRKISPSSSSTYQIVSREWREPSRKGKHAPYEETAFRILAKIVRSGVSPHFPLRMETEDREIMEVSNADLDLVLRKMEICRIHVEDYRKVPAELFPMDEYLRDNLFANEFGREHQIVASLLSQCIQAVKVLYKIGISHGDLYVRNVLVDKISPHVYLNYHAEDDEDRSKMKKKKKDDESSSSIVVETFGLLVKITDFGLCFGPAVKRNHESFDGKRGGMCAMRAPKKHVMRISE